VIKGKQDGGAPNRSPAALDPPPAPTTPPKRTARAGIGPTEAAWRDVVVQYARLRGWLCYWTWRSDHSPRGFPDLVLVRAGRLIAAELKSEAGRLRPEQEAWLRALRDVPAIQTAVWRPSQWEEVRDALV